MSLPPDGAPELRAYVAGKQEVTDAVQEALQVFRSADSPEFVEACQELLVKLAEDRFNLAVVGQFKRGKSTLMNAIIGRELLPAGLLPLTSAITALCYGPREGVWLRRRNSRFEQEVEMQELADFVTERGNPGNEKGLIEARVELPLRFLRRGLHFLDTPGIGSALLENTATTYEFLPKADAVIFVTSVEAPLSEPEERFLRDIRAQVPRLLIVVNKTDMLDAIELEEVIGYIRGRIAKILSVGDVRLFPVSASQALAAKVHPDADGLIRSGLPGFEAALSAFLANEQGRTFLVGILDRLTALLASDGGRVLDERSTTPEDETSWSATKLRVAEIRDRLVAGGPLTVAPSDDNPAEADLGILEEAVQGRGIEDRGIENRGAVRRRRRRTGACPICASQSQAIFEFFAHWQHELATRQGARRAFAAAGGFCPAHSWQFQQIAAPQDLSRGYVPLVESAIRQLRKVLDAPTAESATGVAGLLQTARGCPACRVLHAAAASSIAAQLERRSTPLGRNANEDDEDLCLLHLSEALRTGPTQEAGQSLISRQIHMLEELAEEMRSYSLKRDAIRRGLINSREADAWRRALVQFAGEPTARGVVLGDG